MEIIIAENEKIILKRLSQELKIKSKKSPI